MLGKNSYNMFHAGGQLRQSFSIMTSISATQTWRVKSISQISMPLVIAAYIYIYIFLISWYCNQRRSSGSFSHFVFTNTIIELTYILLSVICYLNLSGFSFISAISRNLIIVIVIKSIEFRFYRHYFHVTQVHHLLISLCQWDDLYRENEQKYKQIFNKKTKG